MGALPVLFKRLASLLTLLAGLSLTNRAEAAHQRLVHDLTSLVFESEIVVLVRADGEALVVDRALGGKGLAAGERIELEGAPTPSDVGKEPAILFLKRVRVGGATRWSVVESGERFTVDGRVVREVQEMGRLNPIVRRRPVGEDPLDTRGLDDRAEGEGATLVEVERQIQRAVERAARVRKLLEDIPANRAALLDELGPVDDDADPNFGIEHRTLHHHDTVAVRILESFAAAGDATAVLEGHARARSRLPSYEVRDVRAAIVAVAADPSAELRHRLAALDILGRSTSDWITKKPERDAVLALRNDAMARVRAAALRTFALDDTMPPKERALLWDRWSTETDPEVQLEMMHLARHFRARAPLDPARIAEPVVFAERRGRRIHFAWDGLGKPWYLVDATVETRPKGAKQGTGSALPREALHCWGRGPTSACEGGFELAAPPAEDLEVSVAVTLERDGQKVRRLVPLAPRAATRGPENAPSTIAPTAPSPTSPEPPPPASGCSCGVAAAPPAGALWWAFVVGALARRRRPSRR